MTYHHDLLAMALEWKFRGTQGISTCNGWLTSWPSALGTWPSDAQQATWVAEYEAYLDSAQCKDDELQTFLNSAGGKAVKALALVGIDKGVWTLADLKAKYRSL